MTPTPDNTSAALNDLLDTAEKGGFLGSKRKWLLLAGALVVLFAGLMLLGGGGNETGGNYITEEVTLGNLMVIASASGTLQPT